MLLRPTFRNLTDSYETWAHRKGLVPRFRELENRDLIERDPDHPEDRLYRLTRRGRLQALGGRHPQACWTRKWDGRWRLVLFDVPTTRNSHRVRLRRYLRARHFGFLQKSAWVSPDPMDEEAELLAGGNINVGSLILLEAHPCAGESNEEIVAGAWDFEEINNRYLHHLNIVGQKPEAAVGSEVAARAMWRWAAEEHETWLSAVNMDPLLPQRILPRGYLGQRAWQRRVEALEKAGRQIRSFKG